MMTDTLLTTQNKILLILDRINEIQDKAETIQHVEFQENYTEQYMNDMAALLIPRVKDTLFQINQMTLIPIKDILVTNVENNSKEGNI